MKLKYYLRGLGIGIVVTAIIMTVALGNKQPMTDEEVIARAKELGMIENTLLKDVGTTDKVSDEQTPDEQTRDEQTPDEQISNEQISDEQISEPSEEKEDIEKTDNNGNTEETEITDNNGDTEETPNTEQKDVVSITVVGGDSSWTVAKRMEEAGLVDSAKDFDAHLCRYGYDKKISVGTYDIPKNATHEEMAKIITKTN